jgi:hypothetical protein
MIQGRNRLRFPLEPVAKGSLDFLIATVRSSRVSRAL